jgi:hypothetical protein
MQAMNHRKCHGALNWVHAHMLMTLMHSFDRVPLPDKGEHVARRGRKAMGQSWSLVAGLPKAQIKGKRLRQFIPGRLA